MNLEQPSNGFRRKNNRPLSRQQLTSVMDETAPAVIQHAHLIEALQKKIREQDDEISHMRVSVTALLVRNELPIRARYQANRNIGLSRLVSFLRAL